MQRRVQLMVGVALLLWSSWAVVAMLVAGVRPDGIRPARIFFLVLGVGLVWLAGAWRGTRARGIALGFVCSLVTAWYFVGIRPPTQAIWAEDVERIPSVRFDGNTVHVSGVRAFRHVSAEERTMAWREAEYDIDQLVSVDLVVTPEADDGSSAQTWLSFGFHGGAFLTVAVVARVEQGETFGAFQGAFRQFELAYVFSDERDILEHRAIHQGLTTYLHPLRATPVQQRALLLSVLLGAQAAHDRPSFFHPLVADCNSVLASRMARIGDPALNPRILRPRGSDRLAFELGLIDTDLDLEATRAANRVEREQAAAGTPDFSQRIREGRTGS